MNVNEALQFADSVVFEQTGKHLDDLQRAVVEGTWQRQTYDDMAKKYQVTKNHLSDVGSQLWQLLSEALGEDIKKSNFCSTLTRLSVLSSPIIIQSNNQQNNNHTFNFELKELSRIDEIFQKNNQNSKSLNHDLTLAPQIISFYERETELKTLSHWLLNQNIRLISVLGLSGIGKTALVKRFVDLNLDKFEVIIWRSLKFPKSLELLVDDILTTCNQSPHEIIADKLKQLFAILTEKKSLIILDDVQNLFIPGVFAGQYQTEYQDYQSLFKMITDIEHQSNLILISQEQCAEMHCLDEELYSIKYLELLGIDDSKILENIGLNDRDSWLKLIELYEGNLAYLKDIASLIKDVFAGQVAEFLAENNLIITTAMESRLKHLFTRLSPVEQEIVLRLSNFENPVSRQKLKETLELSSMEYINGLQSLRERYLIATTKTESIYFSLSPIFRKYISKFEGISSRNSCSEKLFYNTEQRRIGETPTATRHNIL
jgi:hypothetical protein